MAKTPAKKAKELSLTPAREKSKAIPTVSALNPAQKQAIRSIASPENTIVFINGIAGTGKAQPLRSSILTPRGFRRMSEMQIGDTVCTPNGRTANVSGVFPQGEKEIYRIHFSDGDFADCCEDHLWLVSSTRNLNKSWQNKVVDTRFIADNYRRYGRHLAIPTTHPVAFEQTDVLLDPYLMGILLGDGCLTHAVSFSTVDEEVLECVEAALPQGYAAKYRSGYDYNIARENGGKGRKNDVLEAIRSYSLDGLQSHEKFIPAAYLHNSEIVRLELLRGLMDSDGWVEKNGQPYFATTSEQMAKQFEWLVKSLGGLCTLRPRKTTYTHNGRKLSGKMSFTGVLKMVRTDIFKLARKVEKCVARTKYFPKRIVERVEKLGIEPAQCIMLDSAEHLYITDNFIVTHNTFISASWGLEQFIKGKFERLVFTRPYVEAGESLGYLPGTYGNKIAPFMIPIFDVLHEHLSNDDIESFVKENRIVTLPIAYMRGVTFKNAFVLLDEGQNTTIRQMHLFLTRVGQGSKVVVTGDAAQSDIKGENGFRDALDRLQGVKGLEIVELDRNAVVRHEIIPEIDRRYTQT